MANYASPISGVHSCFVDICSDDAQNNHHIHGNGEFKVTISNANRVTQAIKVVVDKVILPHVFTNINQYTTKMVLFQGDTVVNSWQTNRPQWTTPDIYAEQLVVSFGAPHLEWEYFNHSSQQPRFRVKANADNVRIVADYDWFVMMGLVSRTLRYTGPDKLEKVFAGDYNYKLYELALPPAGVWTDDDANVVPQNFDPPYHTIPNFGGPTLAHIEIHGISNGNYLSSDGHKRDVLCTVPLHNVRYGEYACFSGVDIFMGDVEFQSVVDMSKVTVRVLDSNFRVMFIPENYLVNIILKVFHVSTYPPPV